MTEDPEVTRIREIIAGYFNPLAEELNALSKKLAEHINKKALPARQKHKLYVYRESLRAKVKTYEIGYINDEYTPAHIGWCDVRLCEGFWGSEDEAKNVVDLLNRQERGEI